MMSNGVHLRAWSTPYEEPPIAGHVVHWPDVRLAFIEKTQAPDVVAPQQGKRFSFAHDTKGRPRRLFRHDLLLGMAVGITGDAFAVAIPFRSLRSLPLAAQFFRLHRIESSRAFNRVFCGIAATAAPRTARALSVCPSAKKASAFKFAFRASKRVTRGAIAIESATTSAALASLRSRMRDSTRNSLTSEFCGACRTISSMRRADSSGRPAWRKMRGSLNNPATSRR